MEGHEIPLKSNSSSLFPAYASSSNSDFHQSVKPEWLCNSSFTADPCETPIKLQKLDVATEHAQATDVQDKKTEKKHKKKKKKKRKEIVEEQKIVAIKTKLPDPVSESSSLKSYFNKLTFLEETGLSDERAFRLDTKPDYETLSFGSIDRKAIAKYFERFKIPLGSSKLEIKYLQKIVKNEKRVRRYFLKQSKSTASEEIRVVQCTKDVTLAEYIPFNVQSSKPVSVKNMGPCFDGISTDWKSPLTKHSIQEDVSDVHSLEEQDLHKKKVHFNNAVMQSPHDQQLWLDFVDFQHKFFQVQSFCKNDLSEKSLIEKQIAILDKALSHNPGSVKLLVTKLKLRRNLQETEELITDWENLIFYHPNDLLAWQQYLLFIMSDVSYFTISRIMKIYKKCLKSLCNIEQGIMRSHSAPPGLLLSIIEIFGDLCATFYNSGHTERAFGAFQAIMEFNLFSPPSIVNITSCADRVTFFEPYWDCGSARIGEQNALGWAMTISEKKIISSADASTSNLSHLEDKILDAKLPVWNIWLEFEKLRTSNHWLPWRLHSSAEETCDDVDDPDRLISFEQISGFLFKVEDESCKFFLFCKFLTFLGVRLHFSECPYFPNKSEKSLLLFEHFDYLSDIFRDVFPDKKVPNCFVLKNAKLENHLQFISNVFLQANEAFSEEYKQLASLLSLRHSINVALTPPDTDSKWSPNLKNLRKTAKSLLKKSENRNCLFLWSEYIHIEYDNGSIESADQMFEQLYASSSDMSFANDGSCKILFYFVRRYVEISTGIKQCNYHDPKLSSDIRNKIVVILTCLGINEKYVLSSCDKKSSPALLIKALTNFKLWVKREFSILDFDAKCLCKCLNPQVLPVVDCLLCGVYLHYFAQGLDVSLKFLEDALQCLEEKMDKSSEILRYIKEQIFVSKAEVFNFHHQVVPSSLKKFQLCLCDGVEKFPRNVRLLHLLVKTRTASVIVGPTRRFFFKLLNENTEKFSPLTWLFAIIFELSIRYHVQEPILSFEDGKALRENLSSQNLGLVWKIRSLFERCTKSTSSRQSVALWRSYIKYEILNADETRALTVFHKALQNCPWSKALLLDGIEYFNEECQQLIEIMSAKQLRVRTPFEEVQLLTEHTSKEM